MRIEECKGYTFHIVFAFQPAHALLTPWQGHWLIVQCDTSGPPQNPITAHSGGISRVSCPGLHSTALQYTRVTNVFISTHRIGGETLGVGLHGINFVGLSTVDVILVVGSVRITFSIPARRCGGAGKVVRTVVARGAI